MLLHAATLQAPPWILDHVSDAPLLYFQRIRSAWELKCFFGATFSQELTDVEQLGYLTHPPEIPARSGALYRPLLELAPLQPCFLLFLWLLSCTFHI